MVKFILPALADPAAAGDPAYPVLYRMHVYSVISQTSP